ncbi:MAG: hypothetical protein HWN66_00585 [Candidatus Helarchaeota archaeon]|nr:hypothetical protein [Candidatus Helarchaeota archaeon]
MGRKSQEEEICKLILDELYDIKEKKGINFNNLFKKIKKKRGKFSYDTLSKYLNKMERDGRIIRIIDVNSNRKIKPVLLFKNFEIINLRNEKINFNRILMDHNTKFHKFPNEKLKNSDFFPKFHEIISKLLKKQMNLNIDSFSTDEIINKDILLENFNLFLVENPELKGTIPNFDDIILLIYLNLLELIIDSGVMNTSEIHYNIFFHINFSELFASIILKLANIIQRKKYSLTELFLKRIKAPKMTKFTDENVLQLLLNQLQGESKENIKDLIQKKRLDAFSERYKRGLKIY